MRRARASFAWLSCGPVLLSGLLVAGALPAGVTKVTPREQYILFCAGCHGFDGEGGGGDGGMAPVPPLNRDMGVFLHDRMGRAYLVNVGGVATAGMDDAETASVLNYMLLELGEQRLPAGFAPYTPEEVASLRARPLADAVAERRAMRQRLKTRGHTLPPYQWEDE